MEEMETKEEFDTQKGKYVTFQSGDEFYGIKIQNVNEIIVFQEITAIPETEDYIKGLINLRGKIIPVIDVRLRFGQPEFEYNDRTCIIVLQVKSTCVGLVVEKIAEVVEIQDDDILPPPTLIQSDKHRQRYVYGIGKIGDSVKLLLDPDKLLNDDEIIKLENKLEQNEENEE